MYVQNYKMYNESGRLTKDDGFTSQHMNQKLTNEEDM